MIAYATSLYRAYAFVELGQQNFTNVIESNDYSLVVFYAPSPAWVKFQPDFQVLENFYSRSVHGTSFKVQMARVNVRQEMYLSTHSGKHTLMLKFFFRGANKRPIVYRGILRAKNVFSFVNSILSSEHAHVSVENEDEVMVLVRGFVTTRFLRPMDHDGTAPARTPEDYITDFKTLADAAVVARVAHKATFDPSAAFGMGAAGGTDADARGAAEDFRRKWIESETLSYHAQALQELLEVLTISNKDSAMLARTVNAVRGRILRSGDRLTHTEYLMLTLRIWAWDLVAQMLYPEEEEIPAIENDQPPPPSQIEVPIDAFGNAHLPPREQLE